MNDLRHALRSLARNPAFSLVAITTLALGIGATTAIWSVVHAVLLRPLPYPAPERLVIVWENDRIRGTERETASFPDYLDLVAQSSSYEALGAMRWQSSTLTGLGDEALRATVPAVTPAWIEALGARPLLGRGLIEDDARPDSPRVVVLAAALWRDRFGSDPGVVARSLRVDGVPHQIVGVLPDEVALLASDAQAWVAITGAEQTASVRGVHNIIVLARLRAGVELDQAQVEASSIMARLETSYPDDNRGRGALVARLHDEMVADARTPLFTMLGAVAGVLLIACVNVANLLLVRATVRERELAVRAALGGSRRRIARALLVESLALGLLGGAAGVGLAFGGLRALRALAPPEAPGVGIASIDGAVLLASATVVLASVAVFGLIPAWRASRVDSGRALAPGTRGGGTRGGERARHLLVATEAALSVVLVVAAALLLRSFLELRRVDPGYAADGLVTLRVELPAATYPPPDGWPRLEWPRVTQFHESLLERVRALPGVNSAGLAFNGPAMAGWTTRVSVEGRPEPAPGEVDEATYSPVSAEYLQTLGVPLRRGRWLSIVDRRGAPMAIVVNESFARRHFADGDPIGQRVSFFGVSAEVVGVIGDMRSAGLLSEPRPTFYPALAQHPSGEASLVARTNGDPAVLAPALRAAVRSLDPEVATFDVTTVREQVAGSIARQRFTALLLAVFAALALLLAAIGVYGVVAFSLAQRTREIGLRIALGAGRREVLLAAMRRGLASSGAGIVAGLVASLGAGRLLRSQLFGVGPADPATYLAVVAALLLTAVAAAYLPARRATRIAPAEALRQE